MAQRTPDETFGKSVREFREDNDWSMTEFASRLAAEGLTNFHATTVSRLERGERPVRLSEALVIAKVLNASLDDLAAGFDPVGDEDIKDAQVSVIRASQRAAHALNLLTLQEHLAGDALEEAREALREGDIAEEHVPAVDRECGFLEALLEDNLVEHWKTELSKLPKEEWMDFSKAFKGWED